MEFAYRSCPICQKQSDNLHLEENFKPEKLTAFSFASRKEPEPFHLRLYLCDNCDLIYANPALPNDFVKKEYVDAAFDSNVEAGYAARTYARYLPQKNIIKSALDIGCGGGEFLRELQKNGVNYLHGIEPSKSVIATSHPDIKKFIKEGFFEKKNYAENSFDLVSCFQTLEHIPDPLQLSCDAYSLLKEGGRFFVVTHDFSALTNQFLGTKSPIYDIEHFQLFSQISLRQTLENAGFKKIRVFRIINNYPLFYLVKLMPGIPSKKRLIEFLRKIKIGYFPLPLPLGNIAAIAEK